MLVVESRSSPPLSLIRFECADCIYRRLRSRARAHFAEESYEAAVAGFAAAFQEAPAGTAEERAMKTEHRQAQVALKRSKTVDCACHPYSDAVRRSSVADEVSLDTSADYKILGVGKDATEVVRAAVHCIYMNSQLTLSLLSCSRLDFRAHRRSRRRTGSKVWFTTRTRVVRKRSSRR